MDTYIVGNWKMNQNLESIKTFFEDLNSIPTKNIHAWISPQAIHIPACLGLAPSFIKIGSQNSSHKVEGAFTGEISPKALKEIGASFTLVGHSERREYFHETNDLLLEKIKMALDEKLKVIFCIGETLKERETGKTLDVIKNQLSILAEISEAQRENIIVAYEPVWAIGTGLSATSSQAEEVHSFIRKYLSEIWGNNQASLTPLLYGGSVKPENIKELLSQENINGALVGGASLNSASFQKLYSSQN